MIALPQRPAGRWAISFADMTLLIACILMLGWRPMAGDRHGSAPAREQRVAADRLFLDNEALLSTRGQRELRSLVRAIPVGASVQISVGIGAHGTLRLDAWELAAARTAALARRLGPARQITLAAPQPGRADVVIVWR
jgi:hypothetical protein